MLDIQPFNLYISKTYHIRMKKFRLRLSVLAVIILTAAYSTSAQTKFQKWQQASFFRGFDVGYYCSEGECEKTQQDFDDMKTFGANLAQINVYAQGFREIEYPFEINEEGIALISEMVDFCRNAELYYTVAVRSGPGRYDVSDDLDSPVWHKDSTNTVAMYGKMLKEIAQEFANDTLFVGLNLTVEPDPFANEGYEPAELKVALLENEIDLYQVYKTWIDSVRSFDTELPLLVQGPNWSDPEYFGDEVFIKKQDDPYIIYDFHTYQPYYLFTNAYPMNTATYPVNDWCVTTDDWEDWDSVLYADVIFSFVKDFQQTNDVPIFMGEFGMWWPQNNGEAYLNDLYEIAIANDWHFALWAWRADTALEYPSYNYELFDEISSGSHYLETVQDMFPEQWNDIENSKFENNNIKIYPNPCNADFYVKTDLTGKLVLDIFNAYGEKVYTEEYFAKGMNQQKNVSFNSSPGVYFIRINTIKKSYTTVVIKQ